MAVQLGNGVVHKNVFMSELNEVKDDINKRFVS